MNKLIIIFVVAVSIIFSACSGSNEQVQIRNKGYEPNNTDKPQTQPKQIDSTIIPKPDDIPIEEENHEIKWI